MELRSLKTFIQVVETGSFTKAAQILGYTQSTVSLQIKELENELDCRLFDRIGKTIELTSRGRLLHKHALQINNSVLRLTEDFKKIEEPSGQVHMYSADSIFERMMLENYAEFYKTYPDIRLVFSTGSTRVLLDVLERNEADIIFTLDSHVYRQNFVIARESPVKLMFVAGKGFPLAGRGKISINRLIEYPFFLTESGTSYRRVLDEKLSQLSLETKPVLETGRTDIIIKIISGGLGAAYLPEFTVADHLKKGDLVKLEVEGFDITIWKQLIYRKDKWISGPLKAFIDFVLDHEFKW